MLARDAAPWIGVDFREEIGDVPRLGEFVVPDPPHAATHPQQPPRAPRGDVGEVGDRRLGPLLRISESGAPLEEDVRTGFAAKPSPFGD